METRPLLAIILSLAILMGFQYYMSMNAPEKPPEQQAASETAPGKTGENAGGKGLSAAAGVAGSKAGASPVDTTVPAPAATSSPASGTTGTVNIPSGLIEKPGRDITVETDLFRAVFAEQGGAVKQFKLKKYKITVDPDSDLVDLVTVTPPDLPLIMQVGSSPPVDLRKVLFKADRESLDMSGPRLQGKLVFTADLADGVKLKKVFTFKRGSYLIDMEIVLVGSPAMVSSVSLFNKPFGEASRYIFSGPSYVAQGKLEEIKLDPGEVNAYSGPVDWVGYGDNYFCTTIIPAIASGPYDLQVRKIDEAGLTHIQLTNLKPHPHPTGEGLEIFKAGLYFGPKEIERLKANGHNLVKAINFGWFDVIAKPVLYLLQFFYKYTHNYGWSIIIVTILIKVAFFPLAQKGARSMKTMQKLQPKLKKLKEKYGDDKVKMQQEMMQLYKTYKVNPMSGCLPMVLQIPVFFALYKVLLQAIELRHAPFMLWINDLSAPDRLMIPGVAIPYLGGIPVLTLLMGISMYFQQKLSPSSLDPTQAKMMQFLPVIFTFMFINFPSGLVLYWLLNNIFSIAQQVYVNKFTD